MWYHLILVLVLHQELTSLYFIVNMHRSAYISSKSNEMIKSYAAVAIFVFIWISILS